ncbi:MAG: putative CRISPR-associated nuclease/helicase Cas3 [Syntrophomonadaceae bacterium]|nr:putative CRISPR-associated nuclease/helicase Cas3 [Bacillota bacterium]
MDTLEKLFESLTDIPGASLYPYQKIVTEKLMAGDNIILRAPTGAGKTWAALLPFLYSRKIQKSFADRVIYALPLKSLAGQLYSDTRISCRKASSLLDKQPSVTIQTGEQQDDRFFQGDIIFTTIDQLLSSYILSPVSLPARLANINTGAILGSLVVLDEFHLLDPQRSLATVVEMLRRFAGLCRFVIMTATLSDYAVDWLSARLHRAAVVDLTQEEIARIEKSKKEPTQRLWELQKGQLSADEVLRLHCGRTLVIVNTVQRSQSLLVDILQKKSKETEALLVHSRFFTEDRGEKEKEIILRFGKGRQSQKDDFIVVSTQVVEAGMDFSADTLLSEMAPMNNLIQRAGRCARYGGKGEVRIFPVENHLPYDKEILDATREVLQQEEYFGQILDYRKERQAVNSTMGLQEKQNLSAFSNLYTRKNRVNQSMDGMLKSAKEELVREVNNVSVLIAAEPEKISFDFYGSWPEMLSVPTGSLLKHVKKTVESAKGRWVAKIPEEDEAEDTAKLLFRWKETNHSGIASAWLVALNPEFAAYSAEQGLVLGKPGETNPIRYKQRNRISLFGYQRQSFQDHALLSLAQYKARENNSFFARLCLANILKVPPELVEKAIQLAIVCHDSGKLMADWQHAAQSWQEYKTPGSAKEMIAHTDFDPHTDNKRQLTFPKRPNHAVEGAYSLREYIFHLFEGNESIASCVLTAIARHHTGFAGTLRSFRLAPGAVKTVNQCLEAAGLPLALKMDEPADEYSCREFAGELLSAVREEDEAWLPLYFYIVRELRLADQAGSGKGGEDEVRSN